MEVGTEETYQVRLEIFEGPLDLLLHLIKQNQVDIYDIPIALIAEQYLAYLRQMRELNLEIAGEFLVMASTLVRIKARMLLPPSGAEELPEEEEDDPRAELVRRLLEYQQYKEVAHNLREKELQRREVFTRSVPSLPADATGEPLLEVTLYDLFTAFQALLATLPPQEVPSITRETLTVTQKIQFIMDRLEQEEEVTFTSLFTSLTQRLEMVVTFLALLELIRLRLVRILQARRFGPIRIFRAIEQGG